MRRLAMRWARGSRMDLAMAMLVSRSVRGPVSGRVRVTGKGVETPSGWCLDSRMPLGLSWPLLGRRWGGRGVHRWFVVPRVGAFARTGERFV